eukprot:780130-Amphidinium_carterae.2
MRSHQTVQQAEAAGLPATYLTGNAEAELLQQLAPLEPFCLGLPQRAPGTGGPSVPSRKAELF